MKFSTPLLFATLAFSVADAENRGLRPRGGGGGGGRGGGMNGGGGGKKGPPSPERLGRRGGCVGVECEHVWKRIGMATLPRYVDCYYAKR
eukprot:scaffold377_cov193-Alexandrium_tamarense.AAC.16